MSLLPKHRSRHPPRESRPPHGTGFALAASTMTAAWLFAVPYLGSVGSAVSSVWNKASSLFQRDSVDAAIQADIDKTIAELNAPLIAPRDRETTEALIATGIAKANRLRGPGGTK